MVPRGVRRPDEQGNHLNRPIAAARPLLTSQNRHSVNHPSRARKPDEDQPSPGDARGGLALAWSSFAWMRTLRYRGAMSDDSVDPASPDFQGPAIFLFWHEYIPLLFYLRPHCEIAMLLSRHRDAEWLSHAAGYMGFDTIRGSSFRGGAQALRELYQKGRLKNLAITPDGPRGPRRQLAPGPIYVASKLQLPLVAMGLGYSRCRRLGTWDKFAVPLPYAEARVVASPFLRVPPDLDRDEVEMHRQRVERILNQHTLAAEQWAADGGDMEGSRYGVRQSMTPGDRRRFATRRAA